MYFQHTYTSVCLQVAKEASDIVILDDRFSSIVASVRWGRSIKENIRKFLTFQLTINIVALTLTFVTACANGGSTDKFPLTPVQLLWVNLIMDSFAALALATEPPSEKLLDYAPQGKKERLITRTMYKNMIGHAIFQTVLLLWLTMTESGNLFFGVTEHGSVLHHTLVFTTFVALQARRSLLSFLTIYL
jgi:magnesium-transporting ATPase (P-type)